MRTDDMINLLVQDLPNPAQDVRTMLLRWWPAAAAVAGGTFLAIAGIRPNLATTYLWPWLMKLAFGAVLALTAIIGTLQIARPEAQTHTASRWLIGVAVFVGLIIATDLFRHGLDALHERLFGRGVLSCLTVIPMVAALPLLASMAALRRGATTAPMAAGALAGLASAGLAILAYGLFCNEDSPLFVAAWYSFAAVISAVAGALLGRTMLKW
jgi:hypothetical protein